MVAVGIGHVIGIVTIVVIVVIVGIAC